MGNLSTNPRAKEDSVDAGSVVYVIGDLATRHMDCSLAKFPIVDSSRASYCHVLPALRVGAALAHWGSFRRRGEEMRMLKTVPVAMAFLLLSVSVLMAPVAAFALVCLDGSDNPCPTLPSFNISADTRVQIQQISDPTQHPTVASNVLQAAD